MTAVARPGFRRQLRRLLAPAVAGRAPAAAIPRRVGAPPTPEAADDAELDRLRGELVRELDRRAAGTRRG